MNNYLASIWLPVVLGIVAGVGYGMGAHYSDLPAAIGEHTDGQMSQPWDFPQLLKD